MYRVVHITVFLVFGGCQIAHTELPPAPTQPRCLIKGWPPTWTILTLLPYNYTSNISYQAQYCHSNLNTKFGNKYESYKTVCIFNETNKVMGNLFQCDMTGVVRDLYPNLGDSRLPPKVRGNTLCTIIKATNNNGTRYSKKKCCSVRLNNLCTGILNLQGTPSAKRALNITWETPADISDSWNPVLNYDILYSGDAANRSMTYSPFTDQSGRPSRQHSVILSNLPPFTRYSIKVECYYVSPSANYDAQVYARTLPEAPNSPPTITHVEMVSSNDTMKSVKLKWKHPPKSKRNGIIQNSVVSYCILSNLSSYPGYLPANGSNLTIHGNTSETIIKGLDVNQDYLVTVMSCTVECSRGSLVYQIQRESIGPSAQASTGNSLSDVMVAVLSVAGVLVVVGLLGISYAVYQRRKKRSHHVPPAFPLPEDLEDSHITPESDISDHLESSDYSRPAAVELPTVESSHERASMLQNENDDGCNSEKKVPSMEEIPLHHPFLN